jgi:Fur family transcriptional regulator, ferric uptake regulator
MPLHTATPGGTSARKPPCGRPSARPVTAAPKPQKLLEWQQQLRTYLSEQNLKYSEQRWKIAELILSTSGHLDAQNLVEQVKQQHPGIGAATVYRNLKVLCEAKILKESLVDAHGRVVYELFDDDHHDHIVCTDCGEIFEFHNDRIEALQNGLIRDMKFSQVKHRHVIYVKCEYAKSRV